MNTQILTGIHASGNGAPLAGRSVKATALPGQHVDTTTVDTAAIITTATTGSDGTWSLTLLQGVAYDIRIDKWGQKTLRVTDDATKEFTTYLDVNNILLAGPLVGTIKIGSKYIKPVLTDENGAAVDPAGLTSIEGLTLGWEII